MDRPFLQGQIGIDLTPPLVLWSMLEFVEASPEQQAALVNPPLSDRAPRNGRAAAFMYAPLALWRRERAKRITAEQYRVEAEWLRWAERNRPDAPELHYKKPLDLRTAPVPKFGVTA